MEARDPVKSPPWWSRSQLPPMPSLGGVLPLNRARFAKVPLSLGVAIVNAWMITFKHDKEFSTR